MNMTKPLCLAAMLIAGSGHAQDATPLKQVQTARALFEIGLTNDDPIYMLTAAKLRKSVYLERVDRAPDGQEQLEANPLEWQDMLEMAMPLIAGDPTLEGLAEDIEAERSKGVTDGPVYSIVKIRPGGKDVYPSLPFTGGKYAEIYVEGPSGTDLNILVRDAKGRLVCSDTDISAIAYCGWRPAGDGNFEITVVNEGNRGGQYSLMTN